MPDLRPPEQRVVVTGMGVVTVAGEDLRAFFDALVAGRSGISRWRHIDERCLSKIGGDMSGFDLDAHFAAAGDAYPAALVQRARKLLRPTPLSGRLTSTAALQAFAGAGLRDGAVEPERFAHVMAGHNVNSNYIFNTHVGYLEEPDFIDGLYGVLAEDSDVLCVISELLELKGPATTTGAACASGNLALMAGLDLLRSGRADAVLVSGAANELDPVSLHAWAMIDAISYRSFNDDPTRASRPFDVRREGFVPSEGAAAVVLETLAGARARGAPVRAEILGASAACDASRLPKPDRTGQARAMRGALRDARTAPAEVQYVNAHATSTPLGDGVEVEALKSVFGEDVARIPVNATKSVVGHCLAASGVVELIATILQIENGVLHPTINLEEQDPAFDLDFVPNQPREQRVDVAISNGFGFGGLNSCVVVGRAR